MTIISLATANSQNKIFASPSSNHRSSRPGKHKVLEAGTGEPLAGPPLPAQPGHFSPQTAQDAKGALELLQHLEHVRHGEVLEELEDLVGVLLVVVLLVRVGGKDGQVESCFSRGQNLE